MQYQPSRISLAKPGFKQLQELWYKKAKASGFTDIEVNGNLKQHDIRTIAFENRERIREFFMKLDHYLESNNKLPDGDRNILTLYTNGIFIKDICKVMGKSHYLIKKTIMKYRRLLNNE